MLAYKRGIASVCRRGIRMSLFSATNSINFQEKCVSCCGVRYSQVRGKRRTSFGSLFQENSSAGLSKKGNVNAQLTKATILQTIKTFSEKTEIKELATDHGLSDEQFRSALLSFRKECLNVDKVDELPMELQIIFSDMAAGAGHPDDLFPYFINHATDRFPQLKCMKELQKISDLRNPASWYPLARTAQRKIIYHAGPTNSGKTYHALQRFLEAEKSVYCGPLKMLASEVFIKSQEKGISCDLLTGDGRVSCDPNGEPASRVSCTVEMTALNTSFEVAVIDEIQMVQDPQRGWAWTRALLGVAANEVHLCGEEAAIDLVRQILESAGEQLEVKTYKRLTPLKIEDQALQSLANAQPGDCIVCFNRKDIFSVVQELESLGKEVAVIYGSLPPGTKSAQAKKFNDIHSSCSIMVATDAVGMGLNLNIRRVIFYTIRKTEIDENKRRVNRQISISQALQIAGRAGRYGTQYSKGFVTTYLQRDLPLLKSLLASTPDPAQKAGLHPTSEQIELFSYHLPNSSLQDLIDVFTELCRVDHSLYFMCNLETLKVLADAVNDLPLSLRARFLFCCAPVNIKVNFVIVAFTKMARQYSNNNTVTAEWLKDLVRWPLSEPQNLLELLTMEYVHDIFDVYLWLSFRFGEKFVDAEKVREMQTQLDKLISQGVTKLKRLIEKPLKTRSAARENNFDLRNATNKGGSLSQMVVDSGIISRDLLEKLKQEWLEEQQKAETSSRRS